MAPYLIILLALQASAKMDTDTQYDMNSIQDKFSDIPLQSSANDDLQLAAAIDQLTNADYRSDVTEIGGSSSSPSDMDRRIMPTIQAIDEDKTELQFSLPIEWVNVNSLRNAIVLKFFSPNTNYFNSLDPEELKRLRALHENSFRLGKRLYESLPESLPVSSSSISTSSSYPSYPSAPDEARSSGGGSNEGFVNKKRSHQVVRDSRGDNFMRFGRSVNSGSSGGGSSSSGGGNSDFMRFGRNPGQDFMRFGRDPGQDFMRFGRNPGQDLMRFKRNPGQDFMRFGRDPGQDFMRFGRSPAQDFMRFGRDPGQDFMRFGRSPTQDFMRFGRDPGQDFMRFGRTPGKDFMRFGRAQAQDFMRFGRSPAQDFTRFGRSPAQDFMRFGRSPAQDFMRFGRSPAQDFMRFDRSPAQDFMRFGRNSNTDTAGNNLARYSRPDNFMRFGRVPPPQQNSDFMRFGKSPDKAGGTNNNHTNAGGTQMSKNELKQAVKLIHAGRADSNDNPVDKAMKVLFDKHHEQEEQEQIMNHDPADAAMLQHDNDDLNMETEYFLKNLE